MTSAAVAFDKHPTADKHDAATDDDAGGEVLDKLFGGLDAAYLVLQAHRDRGRSDALDDDQGDDEGAADATD